MNVFILCAGRCGSMTFAKACTHATNYSVGHDSRIRQLGEDRLDYPDHHIEADNRLSWMLGRLDLRFGAEACYVHLRRDRDQCAHSHNRRWERGGMMHAYARAILNRRRSHGHDLDVCYDYLRTVDTNIQCFLKDKPHQMRIDLEHICESFPAFWHWIGAEGDLDAALRELQIPHNAAKSKKTLRRLI